jgi:NADH-quinone oxidoreductase subunit N
MSARSIISLLPMIILGAGVLLTMLLVKRNHKQTFVFTLLVFAASFISLFAGKNGASTLGELFIIDPFGIYFQGLLLLSAFVVAIFSYISLQKSFPEKRKEEYYILLQLATLGASMMVICTHFISFFVSLEILTVSLYALISYYRERLPAIEAGLKYLMLAAMSSSFLLFGMALIYAISGTMSFHALATLPPSGTITATIMLVAGVGMMVVGIGFKLGIVPFHMWTSDVYEGASSPISAFIATVSKGAMVALLLRFFMMTDLYRFEKIILVFTIISLLSMLIGNLLALLQNNIKRMLAYSSVAHFGYLLIALISGKELGLQAATFYVTTYIIAITGAFGMIVIISNSDTEASNIQDYQGLFWRKPFLAALLTITLLSLAGIPLTVGFISKFFLLTAGIGNTDWLLTFTIIISSVFGLYYYLRLIASMMQQRSTISPLVLTTFMRSSTAGICTIALLSILVIGLGIYPTWLVDIIDGLHLSSGGI